jgi:hypothetical protein
VLPGPGARHEITQSGSGFVEAHRVRVDKHRCNKTTPAEPDGDTGIDPRGGPEAAIDEVAFQPFHPSCCTHGGPEDKRTKQQALARQNADMAATMALCICCGAWAPSGGCTGWFAKAVLISAKRSALPAFQESPHDPAGARSLQAFAKRISRVATAARRFPRA